MLASVRRDDTKKKLLQNFSRRTRTHATRVVRNAPVNVQVNRGSRRGVRLFFLLFPKRKHASAPNRVGGFKNEHALKCLAAQKAVQRHRRTPSYRRYSTILSFTKRLLAFSLSRETALADALASSLLFS